MKRIVSFLVAISYIVSMQAVPACPTPFKVFQPDGSSIQLQLNGDEANHYVTTKDGYTVVQSEITGEWQYAVAVDSELAPSGIVAHRMEDRSPAEINFLRGMEKGIYPAKESEMEFLGRQCVKIGMPMSKLEGTRFDYSKFRGLVILVEYNDRPFMHANSNLMFDELINKPQFRGFSEEFGDTAVYTGSVRDYFSDNSGGLFIPHFDVVGPIKVDCSATYPSGTQFAPLLIKKVLAEADKVVDFSEYDTDSDGVVDMVYFIFSGAGSNFGGNNSNYIWPHASAATGTFDGVKMGRYACSTELYGILTDKRIDGIGTIVHEFSHVLGVADLYDTDYATNGLSAHPGKWSVMASGSYHNMGRTPPAYSSYERYANGFDIPERIAADGVYSLPHIAVTGKSYRIDSPVSNEFFIFENRQKQGWDKYLPGEGMLVFRVDSTDTSAWTSNKVNCNAAHNYYELLRACPFRNESKVIEDSDGDPFPGSANITSLGFANSPGFATWAGVGMPYDVLDIQSIGTGIEKEVCFRLSSENSPVIMEDFESINPTSGDCSGLQGKYGTWDLTGGRIVDPSDGSCTGSRALGLIRYSSGIYGPVTRMVKSIGFEAFTPDSYGSTPAQIQVSSSSDGKTWTTLVTDDNRSSVLLSKDSRVRLTYPVQPLENGFFKLELRTGSKTEFCSIDNLVLECQMTASGIESQAAIQDNQEWEISCTGLKIDVRKLSPCGQIELYSIDGSLIVRGVADQCGNGVIAVPSKGIYILQANGKTVKIII